MAQEKFTPLQRFWKLLKPDAPEIRNIYFYAIFTGLVSLSLPLGIQAIINLIQGGKVSTAWIVLVFFVVFGIAISGLLQIYQLRISENIQQKIFHELLLNLRTAYQELRFQKCITNTHLSL